MLDLIVLVTTYPNESWQSIASSADWPGKGVLVLNASLEYNART